MTARASVILWSAGSGLLLGLFADAALVGLWIILSAGLPGLAPRPVPRWAAAMAAVFLAAVPIVATVLGLLEGRLKAN